MSGRDTVDSGRRIWVGGAHSDIPREDIDKAFSGFGEIESIEMGFGGYLFVCYVHANDAKEAADKMVHLICNLDDNIYMYLR